MAEEKVTNKPAAQKKKGGNIFKKIALKFREFKSEFKKVVWPAVPQTAKNTLLVLVVLAASAVVVGLLDLGFNEGLAGLASLFSA